MSRDDTIVRMIRSLKPKCKLSDSVSSEESFETPRKKFKKMDDSFISSPQEVRRMRADLLDTRTKIITLESRLSHVQKMREELVMEFQTERQRYEAERDNDRKTILNLESKLQELRKRELDAKTQLKTANDDYLCFKQSMDVKIEELEKKLADLTAEKRQIDGDESLATRHLNEKVAELELLYKAAKDDAEAQKRLITELEKKLKEQKAMESSIDQSDALQKAQSRIVSLECELDKIKDLEQHAKRQHAKLAKYDELERDNTKLKDKVQKLNFLVQNKLLLEEEVHDLKSRLVKYQDQEKKFSVLQITAAQNEMYLEEWRSVARGICESTDADSVLPQLLRNVVERLQQQEVTLMLQKSEAESQLSIATHECKMAKTELEKKQKHITELQNNVQQSQNWIHRFKKKLQLVCRERDSYRQHLDSYEKDLTICINPANTANPGANQLQTQKERIVELEKVVDGYRDLIQKLEGDLQKAEPLPHNEATPISTEQVARLQTELDQMKNENSFLKQKSDELEIKLENLLVGQDVGHGKIIHFAKNPFNEITAEREKELEKCQEEIIKLRRKVKNYEEGMEVSKLGDVSICPKEVQSLKDQIKNGEEALQRLKNYFKSTMQQFRNVIYMLLGYKIDKAGESQYRLTSMYADRAEDTLCFQLKKDNTLNLMETDFSVSLENMVRMHLHKQKSIPVFLSSLTLNLFNNRTMASGEEEEDEDEEDESESGSNSDNDV